MLRLFEILGRERHKDLLHFHTQPNWAGPRPVIDHAGKKAVVTVRHPYRVIESHWQKKGEGSVKWLPMHYHELFAHQENLDYFEFNYEIPQEERLPQMERLAEHFEMKLPKEWIEAAEGWPKIGHLPYKKEPYPGDKSIVDFAVERYGFNDDSGLFSSSHWDKVCNESLLA